MPSIFFVEPRGNLVFRYTDAWTPWYIATLFIHECCHRADILTGRERTGENTASMPFLLGEVRAHTVEDEIVNIVTDGAWHTAIDQVLLDPKATNSMPGFRVKLPTKKSVEMLLSLMPGAALSGAEMSHRMTSANVAVVLRQFADDRKKAKGYHEFIRLKTR